MGAGGGEAGTAVAEAADCEGLEGLGSDFGGEAEVADFEGLKSWLEALESDSDVVGAGGAMDMSSVASVSEPTSASESEGVGSDIFGVDCSAEDLRL